MTFTNVVNPVSYLRTSRAYPQEDVSQLAIEVTKTYIDIANAVNVRTIGIFPTNRPAITGEGWFVTNNQKQETFRQVYAFSAAGNIAHGIKTDQISTFTRIYGIFTDGSVWYPLPYVNVVSATNQVSVTVTNTNIVITAGAGSPPSITSGYAILEWLSLP